MAGTDTRASSGSRHGGGGQFAATRWSVVVAAAADDDAVRRAALGELARTYWPPLYAYLRRDGQAPERAEDLVQGFFARLIEKDDLRAVDRAKGRFRSFLLAALKHYVLNEWDRERALKRGGGAKVLSLDAGEAETRYGGGGPADRRTPEDVFNRRWALTVLDIVLEQLRAEYAGRGQAGVFEALKGVSMGEPGEGYAEIGRRLGMAEGAARVAAHRMRKRYRELLREAVGQTVADPSMVEEELRDLLACLAEK